MSLGQQSQPIEKYHAIRSNSAILGIPLPIFFGQNRLTAKLIWYGDFVAKKAKRQGGKGLGKSGAQYVYTASVMAALCMGPLKALLSVWDSTDKFVVESQIETYTVSSGSSYQYTPAFASAFAADQGPSMVTPYSYGVNDYGSPGSTTLSGNTNTPMTLVSGTPAAGQYAVNASTGIYTFASADAGKTVNINYAFYRYILEAEQLSIVPFSGPFTVTVDNSSVYRADISVVYDPSGNFFQRVFTSPAVGQYSVSGGTYTFNSADAGQGIVINYSYTDPNTDTNAPNILNLTLIGGGKGQSPWSYLTAKHPSQALGYTQVACVASSALFLGYTPELPNYTYEVAGAYQVGGGILDANPADCIAAVLCDPGYGIGFPFANLGSLTLARQCWTANSFFVSPLIENQESTASVIGQWLEAGMVGAYWSEGLLKFVPYCDTSAVGNGVLYQPSTQPVASFADGDYILPDEAEETDDPIKISRSPYIDAFNRVKVTYANRINDYNPELIPEEDAGSIQAYGLREEDPQSYDFITTLASAQYAASMRLQRSVYVRNIYEFTVASNNAFLEPMDVILITDLALGLNAVPVRIQEIEDDPEQGIKITAEDFIYGTAVPAYNPKDANNPPSPLPSQQDPGAVNAPIIFEANNRITQGLGYQLWFGVSGSNANYGGCHVWMSRDGSTYKQILDVNGNDSISGNARMGLITSTLPQTPDPDTTDTLGVSLAESNGELLSGTQADCDNFVTLCLLDGTELISYQTATLTSPGNYNLTARLRRNVFGTPIGAHPAGASFLRVDDEVFKYQLDPQLLAQQLWFKFTAFNSFKNVEQALSDATAYTYTPAGLQVPTWGTTPTSIFQYSTKTNSGLTSLIDVMWNTFQIQRQDGSFITLNESTQFVSPAPATLSSVSGGSLAARTEFYRMTYVDAAGNETTASTEQSVSVPINDVGHIVAASGWPANAVGWNVYASTTSGAETLQNTSPILFPFQSWTEPNTGLTGTGRTVPSSNTTGSLAVPVAPSLSQVAGGALGSRTRFVRVGLVRNGMIYGIAPESSLAVSASNLLKVASPAAVAGYDGWAPLVGSASGSEVVQTAQLVSFGTTWTEPSGGATTAGSFVFSDDPVGQQGIHAWNGISGLIAGGTYYLYPYYNTNTKLIELNFSTAASPALAAIQVANGNIPLSTGAIVISTASGSGGSGSGGGGGGRNTY